MSATRVAVIGAGRIAQEHLKVLTARDDCRVALLCDPDTARRSTAAAAFDVPVGVDSVAEVLRRDDLDAVYVLVSVPAVANVAELFLRAGLPTFVEKPPGLYSADTARLAETAARSGAINMVGVNRRFYATHLAARASLLELGGVRSLTVEAHEDLARVSRTKFPAEVLRRWALANGIHALDLLRFFGGEARVIHSVRQSVENPWPDSIAALLEFESGAQGRVLLDWFGPGGHRFEARGVGCQAVSTAGFGRVTWQQRGMPATELEPDTDDLRFKPGFWKQAGAFLGAVRSGQSPPVPAATLADACRTMQLVEQICGLPSDRYP